MLNIGDGSVQGQPCAQGQEDVTHTHGLIGGGGEGCVKGRWPLLEEDIIIHLLVSWTM